MLKALCGISIGLTTLSSQAEAVMVSVKTFGMAATGVAYPQDALAAAFNPAGPVEICDRVDGGITWARDWGHSKVSGNALGPLVNGRYDGFRTKDFYPVDFGVNKRFGRCYEWAAGLVTYNRNLSKTTFNRPFFIFGTSKAGLEYLNQTISPYIAYKINESHNIGLSVNCQVERLKVNGIQRFDNAQRTIAPGHLTNKGYDWAIGWGATIGWQWHILDNLTFGATYQPRTSMPKFGKLKGFPAGKKIDIPAMWSLGIAWKYCEWGTVAFDVQQYEWNNVRALNNNLLDKDGDLGLLGAKNGPGFGFKNQTFYRVGIDYLLTCDLTVRAGFRYGNIPFGRSQTAVNQLTLDTTRYFVTCGATYRHNDKTELSAFYAYGFSQTLKGKESIPAAFGGGEVDLTAGKFALGVSLGYYY